MTEERPPRYARLRFPGSWNAERRERLGTILGAFAGSAKVLEHADDDAEVVICLPYGVLPAAPGARAVPRLVFLLTALEFPALRRPSQIMRAALDYTPRGVGIEFSLARAEDYASFTGELLAAPVP